MSLTNKDNALKMQRNLLESKPKIKFFTLVNEGLWAQIQHRP